MTNATTATKPQDILTKIGYKAICTRAIARTAQSQCEETTKRITLVDQIERQCRKVAPAYAEYKQEIQSMIDDVVVLFDMIIDNTKEIIEQADQAF